MILALVWAHACIQPVPVTRQKATQIAQGSGVTQAICNRETEKQAGIFVSKILFLEHVGICLAQAGRSSAERELIQCLGDAPIGSHVLCVSDVSSSCIWLGPHCGVPVCTEGWSFQACGMVLVSPASSSLTHLPGKEQSIETVQERGPKAPQGCLLPVLSDLLHSLPCPQAAPGVCKRTH